MKWTRTIPTVEGYYFKRHNDSVCAPTQTMCYVGLTKLGWRVQANGPKQGYTEYGTPLTMFSPQYTEWAGPIHEPTN